MVSFLFPVYLFASGEREPLPEIADRSQEWRLLLELEEDVTAGTADNEDVSKIGGEFFIALKAALKGLDYHHFQSDEQDSYCRFLYEKAIDRLETELAGHLLRRDELEITGDVKGIGQAEETIKTLRRKIRESTPPTLPDKKSIALLETGKREDADAHLVISIRPSVNAFIVSGDLFLPFADPESRQVRVRMQPDEIEARVEEFLDQLKSALLGRPWAALRLSRAPLAMGIFEEGNRLSRNALSRLFPGQHRFLISAPGYHPLELELFLLPGETRVVDIILDERESNKVTVQGGNPETIELYLDGKYMGTTPLELQSTTLPVVIRGEKEGYIGDEQILTGKNHLPGPVTFSLTPDRYDREELLGSERRSFYNSFGLFLLSVPLTMVSYGNSISYAAAGNSNWSEELYRSNTLWYSAYLGGLFLNALLAGDVIFNLLEYMDSYERFHRIERR